ncbi:MAG TPA: hypothetical protein VGI81_10210 [Tepidisphaeraceae bacterium]
MSRHVAPAKVIRAGAFEPAAVGGAVLVDRAAVVVAQEDAPAVTVGEDLLDDVTPSRTMRASIAYGENFRRSSPSRSTE